MASAMLESRTTGLRCAEFDPRSRIPQLPICNFETVGDRGIRVTQASDMSLKSVRIHSRRKYRLPRIQSARQCWTLSSSCVKIAISSIIHGVMTDTSCMSFDGGTNFGMWWMLCFEESISQVRFLSQPLET